jgi:hypothetical protein
MVDRSPACEPMEPVDAVENELEKPSVQCCLLRAAGESAMMRWRDRDQRQLSYEF